jgi:hypothetical protein
MPTPETNGRRAANATVRSTPAPPGSGVAWRFRSYSIRQQRSGSAVKPGQTSPGPGIGAKAPEGTPGQPREAAYRFGWRRGRCTLVS